jgi:hypothetical protein
MRMLHPFGGGRLEQVQLYMSFAEAQEFARELQRLLADPEASEHFHVLSKDGGAEVSVSIVTRAKLAKGRYTAEEVETFGQWNPTP